jgi:hypothetical protein
VEDSGTRFAAATEIIFEMKSRKQVSEGWHYTALTAGAPSWRIYTFCSCLDAATHFGTLAALPSTGYSGLEVDIVIGQRVQER